MNASVASFGLYVVVTEEGELIGDMDMSRACRNDHSSWLTFFSLRSN